MRYVLYTKYVQDFHEIHALQKNRFSYTSTIFLCIFMVDQIFILGSLILSFGLTFLMMPHGIEFLKKHKMGKQIREEALIGKAEEFSRLHSAKM
jgi:hypothetical protein